MFKFIHVADIHLDSPLRGLSRYEGAPEQEVRQAARRALENLVSIAKEESVKFVLIAGDLYDGDWKDHNTGLFFAKQMSELRKDDIKVFIISGNHDAQSVISKSLVMPDNVYLFSERHAESQYLEDIGAVIHGQGFSSKAIKADLSAQYPSAISGFYNIGLLHTSLTGREGHDNYAPCSVDSLLAKGFDYWALGHVHTREKVSEDVPIWFPGNIQGRHIRETGPKGCLLVTVDDDKTTSIDFHELDVVRWNKFDIDITKAENYNDCLEAFRDRLSYLLPNCKGKLIAIRVNFIGESAAHEIISSSPERILNDIRALANDYGEGTVWIEKVVVSSRPSVNGGLLFADDSPMGELVSVIDSFQDDEESVVELNRELSQLLIKLPPELREGEESLRLDDPDTINAAIRHARSILFARLQRLEREA